jgi:hypothetical protein
MDRETYIHKQKLLNTHDYITRQLLLSSYKDKNDIPPIVDRLKDLVVVPLSSVEQEKKSIEFITPTVPVISSQLQQSSPEINTFLKGEKGEKGDRGDRGEKGDRGYKGERGEKGKTGERGFQGIDGLNGPHGTQGIQGINGFQGLQGPSSETYIVKDNDMLYIESKVDEIITTKVVVDSYTPEPSILDLVKSNTIVEIESLDEYTKEDNHKTGSITWDDNYIYVKTNIGWKKAKLELI